MRHQLTEKLKTLRLSGLLDTLDLRLRQAQDETLGYMEFLELLVGDEVERREAKKLKLRLAKASFEEEKTLEGFDFSFNPNVPSRKVRDLAACQFLNRQENVIICGLPGVGKSHLAQAIGHQACRMGHSVLFVKAVALFRKLAAARANQTWDERIREYVRADLLIIDDFGLKPLTTAQADDLGEIVSERYLKGGMLLTSNRRVDEWLGLFPDPVFGNSILDRLAHNAHQLVIEGDSYRRTKKPEA